MAVHVKGFFHEGTGTISYIVVDSEYKHAVIIDSVLDFDLSSGEVGAQFANKQLAFLQDNELQLDWILDTHAHADHLSAANYLRSKTSVQTVIGEGIKAVEGRFANVFNLGGLTTDLYQAFDRLLKEGESLAFGSASLTCMSTPGHTSDSLSYIIEDNVFVGDTLFMPDGGTARCDFPGGDAGLLWDSISRIHQLPAHYKIWVCHDYQPQGRELRYQTTVGESRSSNIHVNSQMDKAQYVALRNTRDKTLAVPKLLYPSLQVNLQSGVLPEPESNGMRYIKIPLTDNTH
ncbi:MBL fold metallo-hydrolase [Paraglaciecola polaris]|uniref:Beta-lactamase hydrolase-like protein n=1 Tax=Paraglaciecola polaris LMG 21857 TaxID=1129793 RepID=K7AB22_9ALTE|nr:MBL fold metallo-hydrolase [Paraglaciecola polaris]GAC32580.1 beta-lactamase hydrolase-like protein [Paraglaciecola polaris LMG 21857]|tara:strand:- start:5751 stop:6617 length:867 start_codon:yes stop_codon:yes gene_type:complete